jgi:hypothetical protein
MDDDKLRPYVMQLLHQADIALVYAAQVNAITGQPSPPSDPPHNLPAFVAMQGLVGAANQIGQLLWPNPQTRRAELRDWANRRGAALCAIVGPVDRDTSPLGSKKLRNTLEHIDERLDEYFYGYHQAPRDEVLGDWHIGPRLERHDSGKQVVYLRHIETGTRFVYSVLGDEIDVQELWDEIDRVATLAANWMHAHP